MLEEKRGKTHYKIQSGCRWGESFPSLVKQRVLKVENVWTILGKIKPTNELLLLFFLTLDSEGPRGRIWVILCFCYLFVTKQAVSAKLSYTFLLFYSLISCNVGDWIEGFVHVTRQGLYHQAPLSSPVYIYNESLKFIC